MDGATDDVNHAIAGELQLMDPHVRDSRERAGQLLDPEFVEVGASGQRWTYEAMLAELPDHPGRFAGCSPLRALRDLRRVARVRSGASDVRDHARRA
jgi:hypothetical protein